MTQSQETKMLQESGEYLRTVLESAGLGLWDWHIKTGEVAFNEDWAEITGHTLEELEPISIETWGSLTHPDDLDNINRALERHLSGELDYYECEARMKHKNGNWIWVLDRGSVIEWDEDGNPTRMVGTHADITAHKKAEAERERLQQEIIRAQKRAIQELSTPIIPLMESIIVMPLIGTIDTMRAKDIMRSLLKGIGEHRARVVILDITGVPIVDSGVANHLNKTIQAARLKGASAIITGISDAVAETIVDLGIDWSDVETLSDLQTGLMVALDSLGFTLQN